MSSGFSFMGIHSSAFRVMYVPDAVAMFDDREEMDVYDEDMEWRNGGLFYGLKSKPREFSMDCFYDALSEREYQRMKQWLEPGNRGRLIFDETPWKYYDVVLTKKMTGKKYVHHDSASIHKSYSGTFTVTMTAYAPPYAKMLYKSLDGMDRDGVSNTCAVLKTSEMPSPPTVSDRDFLVYNCGTITTPCTIRIGGNVDGDGLTIANETTLQRCRIVALPPSPAYLEIDSGTGSVRVKDQTSSTDLLAFEYHDLGYISLAPNPMLEDGVMITYTAGSNTVKTNRELGPQYVGRYIRLEDTWMRILHISEKNMVLNGYVTSSGMSVVTPVVMNRISIEGNAELDRIEVDWEPYVR